MKIFGILGALVIVVIVGAFVYIAVSDVPVAQTMVTKDIDPNISVAAPTAAPVVAPAAVAPAAGTTPAPATPE